MKVSAPEDLAQYDYYTLNIVLAKLFGQWPYQKTWVRVAIGSSLVICVVTMVIPQSMAIFNNLHNWDFLMECAPPLFFCAFTLTKFIFTVVNHNRATQIRLCMCTNWDTLAQDHDAEILHKYAQRGRQMTIVYSVVSLITFHIYVLQPAVPKIIDVLMKNGTKPGKFPLPVDYYNVDNEKYYFYIFFHCYVYTSCGFLGTIAFDTWYLVLVQHSCGLFAVLRRKLQRATQRAITAEAVKINWEFDNPHYDVRDLGPYIERHYEAIEFAKLLEKHFSWYLFFIVGLNMLSISVIGVQVASTLFDGEKTLRFLVSIVTAMFYLFMKNYMAQILMDHSISISSYISNSDWYTLPVKSQKILLMIMKRCNEPCSLTAGKMCVLSLETFGVVLKASVSYFTVLRSQS